MAEVRDDVILVLDQVRGAGCGIPGSPLEPCSLRLGEVGQAVRVRQQRDHLRPQVDVRRHVRGLSLQAGQLVDEEALLEASDLSGIQGLREGPSPQVRGSGAESFDGFGLALRPKGSESDAAPVRGTEQRTLYGDRLAQAIR